MMSLSFPVCHHKSTIFQSETPVNFKPKPAGFRFLLSLDSESNQTSELTQQCRVRGRWVRLTLGPVKGRFVGPKRAPLESPYVGRHKAG